ncbi:MAG: TIGR03751 family conjugal transfer lipoprotein [Gammaproteobacteria bacterium]|nr:TIGR03751 family conjugal transfer lipoprotein [Gammaproteobacteria bacterium]
MRWTRWTTVLLAAGLAGCASNAPSSALAEGPRMIDLFRGTAATATEPGPENEPEPGGFRCRWWAFTWPCAAPETGSESSGGGAPAGAETYARTAANELELLFPRLPNPDIYIHVLPHLATGERVPVPGYTTAVPLYERVEYALPGELEQAVRLLQPGSDAGAAEADGPPMGGVSAEGIAPERGGAP